jgi:hypothetical protein
VKTLSIIFFLIFHYSLFSQEKSKTIIVSKDSSRLETLDSLDLTINDGGFIFGKIYDNNIDSVISLVEIKLFQKDSLIATAFSDAEGKFRFNQLISGKYDIVIINENQTIRKIEGIMVSPRKIRFVDFNLSKGETSVEGRKKKRRKSTNKSPKFSTPTTRSHK